MKKVLLRFYAKNNLGDDLFVKIVTNRYADTFTTIAPIKNAFFGEFKNLIVKNNKIIFLISKIIERASGKRNLLLQVESRQNDLMLYVGGSIFIENSNLKKWRDEVLFYKKLSIPYYILGANVGPYTDEHFLTIMSHIFEDSADVCLRDIPSYNLFKAINTTRLSTDIAFSLKTDTYKVKQSSKSAILSIIDTTRRFDGELVKVYEQSIIDITKKLLKNGYEVTYMSFCKFEGDEIAINRILASLDDVTKKKVKTFFYSGDLDASLRLIASCEIMVATRFHAMVLGLLFSKKVVPITYSKKMNAILEDVNFKDPIIDILSIADFNISNIDFTTMNIHSVSRQVRLSEKQFQELDKVLTRK